MEKILLPLHFAVLGFTAWNVIMADHMGFNWIRGKVTTLNAETVKKYHYRVWTGLGLMILTGFFLFWPLREFLLSRTQFYVKMSFVATLVINSFIIGYLQETAIKKSYASLRLSEKLPLFISGAVSTVCWILTIIAGFYLIPE
jgi:hypothetical protein